MRIKRKLETPRLILRRWRTSDKYDCYEYAKLDTVGPDAGWRPHSSVDESKKIIRGILSKPGTYAVVLKETGKVIGSIGLHDTSISRDDAGNNALEMGYVLNPEYWGQGYIPEAAMALIDYVFSELHLDNLWCGHFDYNDKSRRVCEKCGFEYMFNKQATIEQLGGITLTEKIYKLSRQTYFEGKGVD
jgi:RimJ/RimL family protein N-acetyltransferase